MNAPWTPGRSAGLRDPFIAFASDEASVAAIREAAAEMGWAPDKILLGGLRQATQSLSVQTSPSILLVDLSESGDPMADIGGLAEVCEPGTIVMTMGQINDVRLYRELLANGVQDYLLKPLKPDVLRSAFAQAQAALSMPRAGEDGADRRSISVAVIGTRGGAGATMVASSLAWLSAQKKGQLVALIDLDLHFGSAGLTMDVEPGRGLTDAIENPGRIDGLFLERALVKCSDNLSVMSTEAPLTNAYLSDGSAFLHLQEELAHGFNTVVFDLPRDLLIRNPHLVAEVNAIVIVSDMTLASARDLIRLLSWMKTIAPHARLILVANRVTSVALQELSQKDFEGAIERKVDFAIPLDAKTGCKAGKTGKTLAEAAGANKLGTAFKKLNAEIDKIGTIDDNKNKNSKDNKKSKSTSSGFFGFLSSKKNKKG